jgi:hypothetical protein
MKKILETFTFTNAKELRDWLNHFKETDLSTVYLYDSNGLEYFTLSWEEETLTDGSKTYNMVNHVLFYDGS